MENVFMMWRGPVTGYWDEVIMWALRSAETLGAVLEFWWPEGNKM